MTTRPEIREQALQWFVRLQDEAAHERDWLAFQTWQEADEAHRHAYSRFEQIWAAVDQAGPFHAASGSKTNAHPRTARRAKRPSRLLARHWLGGSLAIAAAVCLTIGNWSQISDLGFGQTYQATDTPVTVDLSDGTRIFMNRDTRLKVRMGQHQRSVTLTQGEAGFDVAHDASKPFKITAGDKSVRVLGTAFNVINDEGQFRVTVARGLVAVGAEGSAAPVHLSAGQQLDKIRSAPAEISTVEPNQAFSWRKGVLIYHDRPLKDVASDLSRYFERPVIVDANLAGQRFTGSLKIAAEAQMLDDLDDYLPIDVDRSAAGIRLHARRAL